MLDIQNTYISKKEQLCREPRVVRHPLQGDMGREPADSPAWALLHRDISAGSSAAWGWAYRRLLLLDTHIVFPADKVICIFPAGLTDAEKIFASRISTQIH